MPKDEELLAKTPPHNLEAEQAVLGGLLIDKESIIKVADILRPEDFYRDAHRYIFEAILELYEKRETIDVVNLSNRLQEKNLLEKVGGKTTLLNLVNLVPSAMAISSYANIIQRKSTLRRLRHVAIEIGELSFQEENDLSELLDKAEQQLFGVSQKYLKQNFVSIRDVLNDAFERIDELHREKGKLRGLPTGFYDLDKLLAGLQKSDLVILAARPSVGKTSLALDIARNVATKQKIPVGIFSLEMSKEQLVDRLLCAEAGVGLWKMRTGKLSETQDDFPKIGRAMAMLSDAPIYIDDSATCNIMEIRTKARKMQSEHGLGMLIIDYLQLMEGRANTDNRVQEIAEITRSLKSIARELNIPVIALSQLSRAVEQQNGPAVPRLAHLRESGSIEQDADVVLFIYRKSADKRYHPNELKPEERFIAEIHIAKHRNGPTGLVNLFFDEDKVSFRNLESSDSIPVPSL